MQIRNISLSTAPSTQKANTLFVNIREFLGKFSSRLLSFPERVVNIILHMKKEKSQVGVDSSDISTSALRKRRTRNSKSTTRFILLLVIVFAVTMGISRLMGDRTSNGAGEDKVKVKGARGEQNINQEFSFPLKDDVGEEVSRIVYVVEKAELRDEIMVQGQRATAIEGRTFLILTLKIKNEYKNAIQIETRDYTRLSVNNNQEEWLAPDIHNDPVEVQAISTKYTRLGFPINSSDKNLVLRVGEIDGEKEMLELALD